MSSEDRRLAYPMPVGVIAGSILSLVSLLAVSRLSKTAVAATGLASYLFFHNKCWFDDIYRRIDGCMFPGL
jgi:hypothetical protein